MRPVSEHRVGRRRSTTCDHISNVAIELFAARGFDEVSVDDVLKSAASDEMDQLPEPVIEAAGTAAIGANSKRC